MKAKRLLLGNLAILSGLITCITLSAFAPALLAQQSISLKKTVGTDPSICAITDEIRALLQVQR